MSLILELDAKIAPLMVALNQARQARDGLPQGIWNMIPPAIRGPIDLAFTLVEDVERWIGRLKEAETALNGS